MEEDLPPDGIITVLRSYTWPIALGAVSLLCITISLVLLVRSIQTTNPIEFSNDKETSGTGVLSAGIVKVDIEGAVVSPGLYGLPEGSRVEDAIAAAGGLTANVDEIVFVKTVNRAAKIIDGAKLYIPKINEAGNSTSHNPYSIVATSVPSRNGIVSINTASQSELELLSGVGPVTAQKIISGRPYQTLEELVAKKAIGASLLEKLRNQLAL